MSIYIYMYIYMNRFASISTEVLMIKKRQNMRKKGEKKMFA